MALGQWNGLRPWGVRVVVVVGSVGEMQQWESHPEVGVCSDGGWQY